MYLNKKEIQCTVFVPSGRFSSACKSVLVRSSSCVGGITCVWHQGLIKVKNVIHPNIWRSFSQWKEFESYFSIWLKLLFYSFVSVALEENWILIWANLVRLFLCVLLPTCWQVGRWPSLSLISSHNGESLVHAMLSRTLSSTWARCVTTAWGRPTSARNSSSITCQETKLKTGVFTELEVAGMLFLVQISDQMGNCLEKKSVLLRFPWGKNVTIFSAVVLSNIFWQLFGAEKCLIDRFDCQQAWKQTFQKWYGASLMIWRSEGKSHCRRFQDMDISRQQATRQRWKRSFSKMAYGKHECFIFLDSLDF